MTGFISTLVTTTLNYSQYSAIADLHKLHSTVAHALGFSVSTSRLLATDLNTETNTSDLSRYHCTIAFIKSSNSQENSSQTDELPVAIYLLPCSRASAAVIHASLP
jgi:hypothetical protein